jgi:hypothetical protein
MAPPNHDGRPPVAAGGAGRRVAMVVGACVALAGLSLLLPMALSYDPWAWLLWGREILHLDLSTRGGPSFKPLPVAFTTLLGVFGGAAPYLWLVVVRSAALLALVMAFRLATRLVGGGWPGRLAGGLAVVGLALATEFFRTTAMGTSEPLLLALTLVVGDRQPDGHHRQAMVAGYLVGLLRPETWPFLGLYALWLLRLDRSSWRLLVPLAVSVPVLWLGPEYWGSGNALRASARAHRPDHGTYASLAHPVAAAAHDAVRSVTVPVLVGGALALLLAALRGRRDIRPVVLFMGAAAIIWSGIVVAQVASGYAGTPRYFMGAAGLLAVLGGVGWGLLARTMGRPPLAWAVTLAATIGVSALARSPIDGITDTAPSIGRTAQLQNRLPTVIAHAGGAARVRSCGTTSTGAFQVSLLAWQLEATIHRVRSRPRRVGYIFDAATESGTFASPPRRGRRVASDRDWRVFETGCRGRTS